MLKRDFILSLIEQFAKELAVFLTGRTGKDVEPGTFDEFYTRYLHKDASFFYESDIDGLRAFINEKKGEERLAYMEMLAELLFQDAPMHLEPATKQDLYMKSLALYEWLDEESKTYSAERLQRMDYILLQIRE